MLDPKKAPRELVIVDLREDDRVDQTEQRDERRERVVAAALDAEHRDEGRVELAASG